jgi:hypothetical protein
VLNKDGVSKSCNRLKGDYVAYLWS